MSKHGVTVIVFILGTVLIGITLYLNYAGPSWKTKEIAGDDSQMETKDEWVR